MLCSVSNTEFEYRQEEQNSCLIWTNENRYERQGLQLVPTIANLSIISNIIMTISSLLVSLLLLTAATAHLTAHELIKFTVSSYILPDKKLSMQLDVVTPRTPAHYPVILYMTGLSGLLPSFFQSNLIDSVAEQGYIYMTISKLESPNPQKISNALGSVVAWVNENMQLVLNGRAPGVIADIDSRSVLIGHSAAGHVTTEYLNGSCGFFKAHIMLDPVDGVDPFGIKKDYIITPGKFLPYAIPVLVLSTELDPAKRELEPPCAPANLSNQRFYNAMSGPKWFLNVSKYGHADFLNNEYRDVAGAVCATCRKDCNFADYRTTVKEAILSFIDAIFYGNTIALAVIEKPDLRVPTAGYHNYMGYDPRKGGFCVRLNQEEKQ